MKQIILARHTETDYLSRGGDKNKRNDSSLSEVGKEQALTLADFIDKYDYQIVLTSLFKRSIQTAEIINKKKNLPIYSSLNFSEYFLDENGKGMETTDMGIARTMPYIYSIFDKYESILIVGHSSINKTILQAITNMEFAKTQDFFNTYGETHVLRLDWKKGDKVWDIIDSF